MRSDCLAQEYMIKNASISLSMMLPCLGACQKEGKVSPAPKSITAVELATRKPDRIN
jgi:hypothetical protein